MSFSSFKWVSSAPANRSSSNTLVVHDIQKQVFDIVGNNECNLISIFGRARQGKSFLMNCLAGEREIFRISNEKDSCTTGIDISNKFSRLIDFSGLDSGKRVSGGNIKVGYVDAEGQGDKDVAYDANLICPILLASKCTIFNWKGDLQKDHILSTLGIMTRAAQSVEVEEPTRRSNSIVDEPTKFGHLHIVFRDWQSVGTSANSVFEALFGMEDTPEASTRDQIRMDVLGSFASIKVWLFDAPSERTQDLRTKLTFEKTSVVFRGQLRDLRNTLSQQLRTPTMLGGRALTGRTMLPMTRLVVQALNAGDVVRPASAYLSMMAQEIDVIRSAHENSLRSDAAALVQELNDDATVGASTKHRLRVEHSREEAVIVLDEYTRAIDEQFEADVAAAVGGNMHTVMAQEILRISKYKEAIESTKKDIMTIFLSHFDKLHSDWRHNATKIDLFVKNRQSFIDRLVHDAEASFNHEAVSKVPIDALYAHPIDWKMALSRTGVSASAAARVQLRQVDEASAVIVDQLRVIIQRLSERCVQRMDEWVADRSNSPGIEFTDTFFRTAGRTELFATTARRGSMSAIRDAEQAVRDRLALVAEEYRVRLLKELGAVIQRDWEVFEQHFLAEEEQQQREAQAAADARKRALEEAQARAREEKARAAAAAERERIELERRYQAQIDAEEEQLRREYTESMNAHAQWSEEDDEEEEEDVDEEEEEDYSAVDNFITSSAQKTSVKGKTASAVPSKLRLGDVGEAAASKARAVAWAEENGLVTKKRKAAPKKLPAPVKKSTSEAEKVAAAALQREKARNYARESLGMNETRLQSSSPEVPAAKKKRSARVKTSPVGAGAASAAEVKVAVNEAGAVKSGGRKRPIVHEGGEIPADKAQEAERSKKSRTTHTEAMGIQTEGEGYLQRKERQRREAAAVMDEETSFATAGGSGAGTGAGSEAAKKVRRGRDSAPAAGANGMEAAVNQARAEIHARAETAINANAKRLAGRGRSKRAQLAEDEGSGGQQGPMEEELPHPPPPSASAAVAAATSGARLTAAQKLAQTRELAMREQEERAEAAAAAISARARARKK